MITNRSRSLNSNVAIALLVGVLLAAAGCGKAAPSSMSSITPVVLACDGSPPRAEGVSQALSDQPSLSFETFTVEKGNSVAKLRARFGDDGFAEVLKLNRVDLHHLREGQKLVVPKTKLEFVRLSPFPTELISARSTPKLLLVSRATQAFAAYEYGHLVRWGPVSTGKKATPTPTGLYFANWKARSTRSSVDPSWVLPWYVNIDSHQGIGLHQYDLPGYAASHGCVRMMKDDAQWVFGWADQWVVSKSNEMLARGTPVIIFGAYAYSTQAPWTRLAADPQAALVQPTELEAVLNQYTPLIKARAQDRLALAATTLKEHALML